MVSSAAFLVLLELALIGIGFGGSHPLFVAADDLPGRLRPNPELMRRYFPTRGPTIGPESAPFAEHKPAASYRIVVQGESTAAGFPYGRFASLAELLAERLEAAFPDRDIEVVSTAMAAINSYALLDLAGEIVAISPDLVVIHAGHNEYMGVLGVGTGLTAQRSRTATLVHLRLAHRRSYQLLQALVGAARGTFAAQAADDHPMTMMSRAARGARIAFGSDAWRAGGRQLEANLDRLLGIYRAAGIPVLIGTQVSNEKDRPPFASASQPAGDTARDWYARGVSALAAGDAAAARTAFRAARDRDELPFRAPGAFDDILRGLAAKHGATLVDVQARFAAASPDGIVGHELLLEHVHPNADGYFLLADAYCEALRDARAIGDWSGAPDREQARRDLPITALDRLLGDWARLELEAQPPFRATPGEVALPEPRTPLERLARSLRDGEVTWIDAMEELLQIHQREGDTAAAAVVARMAARTFPAEPAPSLAAGRLYLELGQPARAQRYLAQGRRAKR